MTTFLHRIAYLQEVASPLLENGFLTIGFSDFLFDLELLKAGKLDETFQTVWGYTPKFRWSLHRFVNDMKIGDIVVVPSWGNFGVYRIESDVFPITKIEVNGIQDWQGHELVVKNDGQQTDGLYRKIDGKDDGVDLGFFRKVSPIEKGISRYDYADAALTCRMKIRQTNADITDLEADVQQAINAFKSKRPINLKSSILDATVLETYNQIIRLMTPDKWEELIKRYFQNLGAKVEQPAKNETDKEGDADIIATFDTLKTIYYIQAKFHSDITYDSWGIEQVVDFAEYRTKRMRQEQNSMTDDYASVLWLLSSCKCFSTEVKKKAQEANVQLVDGLEFTRLLLSNGISGLDSI